jgi:hypothetical protein
VREKIREILNGGYLILRLSILDRWNSSLKEGKILNWGALKLGFHYIVLPKGKVVPVLFFLTEHHTMKAYWGRWGTAPCILELGTWWRWLISFTPWPLYPQEKRPCYLLNRRLGGTQSWSGHGGEEKNSQPLPGLKPLIIQPIAQCYTTELSWLLVLSSHN